MKQTEEAIANLLPLIEDKDSKEVDEFFQEIQIKAINSLKVTYNYDKE